MLAVHAGGHSCVPGRPSAETGRDTALGDHSVGLCRNHSPPVHRTAPLQGRLHNVSQLNGAFLTFSQILTHVLMFYFKNVVRVM